MMRISVTKYAGLGKDNPLAMIDATVMMSNWMGESDSSKALDRSVLEVVSSGKVRTYDMGGQRVQRNWLKLLQKTLISFWVPSLPNCKSGFVSFTINYFPFDKSI
jgi:isocitrate/isopropylmalate dehydrogenase